MFINVKFDVNKFGDEISSFVVVTITYCSCIIQFPNVMQNAIVVHSFADENGGVPLIAT